MSVTTMVIGDPHFKVSNVRETSLMATSILRTSTERNPDIIVVLGDTLDRHEIIHVSPLTRAVEFIDSLTKVAPTYVLIGNHDLKNNRQFLSDEHPFSALKSWGSRVTIVDTTISVSIREKIFIFVPYTPPGRFEEALNKVPNWREATCIFAHQEFRGVKMGAIVSTEGDEWPLSNPYTVSGHIHDYQELQHNLLYTGTPIQHAFGDTHDKSISYITFHSTVDRKHERIDLGCPKKYIVRLNCHQVQDYTPRPNSELKIIISGTSGEIKSIMSHPNITLWKREGYKISYKDIPLNSREVPNVKVGKFSKVFYDAISSEPALESLYRSIFGEAPESS